MTLFTLTEIAAKFARLDGIEDADHAQFEKGLRNLTQRQRLHPTTQRGRVFYYSPAAAVAIRLAQIAGEFGLPRTSIDNLAMWLGGCAAEAISRTQAGESFNLHLIMRADGSVVVDADWKVDRPADDPEDVAAVEEALRLIGAEPKPEVARFSLPASRLIAEVLPHLAED